MYKGRKNPLLLLPRRKCRSAEANAPLTPRNSLGLGCIQIPSCLPHCRFFRGRKFVYCPLSRAGASFSSLVAYDYGKMSFVNPVRYVTLKFASKLAFSVSIISPYILGQMSNPANWTRTIRVFVTYYIPSPLEQAPLFVPPD